MNPRGHPQKVCHRISTPQLHRGQVVPQQLGRHRPPPELTVQQDLDPVTGAQKHPAADPALLLHGQDPREDLLSAYQQILELGEGLQLVVAADEDRFGHGRPNLPFAGLRCVTAVS